MNIKQSLIYSFLVVVLLLQNLVGLSQSDSLEVHTINGREYYIHIVEKGQSLYAIHKKYNVPIEIIKKENPAVSDGLSIGEKVFIPVKRETLPITTNGNYITHEVEKQQTLYSISKLYNVKQNEILTVNPDAKNGLKEGQIIKIPLKKLKEDSKEKETNNISFERQTHTVSKGETLYSLSKMYNVSIDEIKNSNNGLLQGLREGETIILPIKKVNIKVVNEGLDSITPADSLNDSLLIAPIIKKPLYNIALLLPFYLDENDEMTESRSALEERKIYPRSKFAIEFYNGFIKALDSIYTDSCRFKLYVYDTKGDDTLRIKKILEKPELQTIDLIVGPLYSNNFKLVAEFGKVNKVPVVSPVMQNNKVLLGNPYVFKAIPSKTAIIEPISKLLVDSFKTENLLAVAFENAKEKPLIDMYINSYNKKILEGSDTSIYSTIQTLNIKSNVADIVANLNANKNNVVFVPTSNQSTITNMFSYLITTLNRRDYKDYKVTLIGLEEWMEFTNIDMDYYQRLNVHYCSPQYINETDSLNEQIINNYIETNKVYPDKNSLLGFDIGYYFTTYLSKNGVPIMQNFVEPYKGISTDFNFIKTGIESGYENTSIHLLYFNDYTLKKVE